MVKEQYIDERKLAKIMNSSRVNVVNIGEDNLQYCNGYMLVNFNYEYDLAIQNLFKIGALKNYKNWQSNKTQDLSSIIECEKEIETEKTGYLYSYNCGSDIANIFKIEGKYFYYDKKYVDIFKDVTFKAAFASSGSIPILKAYSKDKFIGLVLAVRTFDDTLLDIINNSHGA